MGADEIDWIEMARGYDANAALDDIKATWLRMGRHFATVAEGDWVHDLPAADEAMGWAARAEACFWRATGEPAAIDADTFIKELGAGRQDAPTTSKGER